MLGHRFDPDRVQDLLHLGLNGSVTLRGFVCVQHDPDTVHVQYLHLKRFASQRIHIVGRKIGIA
jgi:hypothetical protein